MKSFLRILLFTLICFTVHAQQTNVSYKPLIWLSADRCGQIAGLWQDISGNGYDAVFQNTQLPDTVMFNFNHAFGLDIYSPGFKINYQPKSTATITILSVYRSVDTATEQAVWTLKLDTALAAALTTHEMITVSRRITYSNSTVTLPVLNSMLQSWRNRTIDTAASHLVLLGGDTVGFKGKLAEFIVFDHTLTQPQFQAIHTYLGLKYGISLRTINYVNGQFEVIWHTNDNQQYEHDIAGIACDTILGLLQKQGAGNGGEAPVIISAGSLAKSNSENTATLNHGDFLIWGDNGFSLEPTVTDEPSEIPVTVPNLLKRTWLLQGSGNTYHHIPTQVVFQGELCDSCIITALVIDTASNGTFHPDSVVIHYPDSFDQSGGSVYFNNIYWDANNTGKYRFTFQVMKPINLKKISQKNYLIHAPQHAHQSIFFQTQCVLFPNPTPDRFNIDVVLPNKEPLTITIHDPTGRLVLQKTLEPSRIHHYEGSVEQPGLYLIHLKTLADERMLKLLAW